MNATRYPAYLRLIGTSSAPAIDRRAANDPIPFPVEDRYPQDEFGVMTRKGLLARLQIVAELAPSAPLSFAVVKVLGLGALNQEVGWRACDDVLRAVAEELHMLVRATDAVGRITGSSFGLVLQGTGATAAAAVEARLNFRLNKLPEILHPIEIAVSTATGTGLNAETLPVAALDSFGDDAV